MLVNSNALILDGELIHTWCFTHDVTERVRLEAELQKRVEQLAEIDRRKDEFLAMLGHELRNPLGAITTSVELMRLRSDDPAFLARPREIVARQAALMLRLVDDLLDTSRISRGTIVLQTEEVLLSTIVERAVELVRSLIDERGHRLTIELTLVRSLVALHGGSIEARSDGPGHGSEFVVCLPLPVVAT